MCDKTDIIGKNFKNTGTSRILITIKTNKYVTKKHKKIIKPKHTRKIDRQEYKHLHGIYEYRATSYMTKKNKKAPRQSTSVKRNTRIQKCTTA